MPDNEHGEPMEAERLPARECQRAYRIEDMTVRSDGSGRVVESYFAVFGVRSEVRDQDGHYWEENARSLFAKTLAEQGLNIPVFYNHARTLDGTPAGELSVPIGVPEGIEVQERGVWNAVRYFEDPFSDRILQAIKNKGIRGMSYSGRYLRSIKSYPQGRSKLPLIMRQEAALREFGPTPIPQFREAEILGTRAQQVLRMLLAPTEDSLAWLGQFEGLTTLNSDSAPEVPLGTSEQDAADTTEEPHLHSARSLAQRIRDKRNRLGM